MPLEWVLMVKCLDPNGQVRYRELTSKNLQPIEALGMLCTMEDTVRMKIMTSARVMRDPEDT